MFESQICPTIMNLKYLNLEASLIPTKANCYKYKCLIFLDNLKINQILEAGEKSASNLEFMNNPENFKTCILQCLLTAVFSKRSE